MICLWLGSTSIAARGRKRPSRRDERREPIKAVGPQPVPARRVRQRRRAGRRGPARRSSLRPGARVGPGRPAAGRRSPARRDRRRAPGRPASRRGPPGRRGSVGARASALVTAIPVPIATSPRARRVMSRQPPAVSAGTNGRSGSPTRIARASDGLDERGGEDQRQVARRRRPRRRVRRRSCGVAAAPQVRARPSTASMPAADALAPGTTTQGRPTNRSAVAASVAGRLATRHRMAADEAAGRAASARATIAAFVLATSVTVAVGSQRGPQRTAELVQQPRGSPAAARRGRRGRRPSTASAADAATHRSRRPPGPRRAPTPSATRRRASAWAPSDCPQRARDGPTDQPEAKERDRHGPSIAARTRPGRRP